MIPVLVFAVVLLVGVLLSGLAHRSVLSTAVLFLLAGFLAGPGMMDLVTAGPRHQIVVSFAELALFVVLFTDGMRVALTELVSAWRLPGRALLLGLPVSLTLIALLAHYVAAIPWGESFLLGAILSPTDPVFAAAIVGREGVPARLRRLLNVESGLNDGLALPVVIALLALLGPSAVHWATLLEELGLGVAIGIALPWAALKLEESRFFSPAARLEELFPFAIGLLVFALASVTHANLFLAAFAAGVTVATVSPEFKESFHRFGQLLSELLKLAAIFVFGALISPSVLEEIGVPGYLFALLTLFLARPFAVGIALAGSDISRREWAAAAWFGPKGFASVVYGLLVAQSGLVLADDLFHLVAVVVAASILLHSSTDVVVARQFEGRSRTRTKASSSTHS